MLTTRTPPPLCPLPSARTGRDGDVGKGGDGGEPIDASEESVVDGIGCDRWHGGAAAPLDDERDLRVCTRVHTRVYTRVCARARA